MKKAVAIVLLAIGVIVIFVSAVLNARYNAKWVMGISIDIPESMHLTIENDVMLSSDEGDVVFPNGTEIVPYYIDPAGTVRFYFECEGAVTEFCISWSDIKEEELLHELMATAEQNAKSTQLTAIKRGVVMGGIQALAWFVVGGLLCFLLSKKEKFFILDMVLVLIPIIYVIVVALGPINH